MTRDVRTAVLAAGLCIAAASAAAADPASCTSDTLCRIMTTKVLKVGTKDDYKPWSYREPSGKFAGIEVDLAEQIGKMLGADVQFVKVNSANRFEFLAQGQIDLMIASASDTADRRRIVGMVHPNYYSSGYNVLLPKAATVQFLGPDCRARRSARCRARGTTSPPRRSSASRRWPSPGRPRSTAP